MTVDNVSYLTEMCQNSRISTTEKQKQKGAVSDVGKTQQSTVSASLDQVNAGQDGIVVTEVSLHQGAEQSTTENQPAAPRMDTVEISEESRAAKVQFQEQHAAEVAIETEQYEAQDLVKYTDTELRQMFYKSKITRQEIAPASRRAGAMSDNSIERNRGNRRRDYGNSIL